MNEVMNIDRDFHDILEKSGIDFYKQYAERTVIRKKGNLDIESDIRKIWASIADESRIAIYGAGFHTITLLDFVKDIPKQITCIVDKNVPGDSFEGYPLIRKEALADCSVNTIVISSLKYGEEIKREIAELSLTDVEVIDIYKELEKKKYCFAGSFTYQKKYEIYEKLFLLREAYYKKKDHRILAALILGYLDIRDFVHAIEFINVYVEEGFEQSRQFSFLKKDLTTFFARIQININAKRRNNCILMVLLDALCFRDSTAKTMPLLLDESRDNIIEFKKYYTHAPYTLMSLASMLQQKKLLDDKLWLSEHLDDGASFFSKTKADFKYYGIVSQKLTPEHSVHDTDKVCSELLWNCLKDAVANDRSQMIQFAHCMETHAPYIGGMHSSDITIFVPYARSKAVNKEKEYRQCLETIRYCDSQLHFYIPLFGKKTKTLVFADHGNFFTRDEDTTQPEYFIEEMIHVPFFIYDPCRKVHIDYEKILDHRKTFDIVLNLLHGENVLEGIDCGGLAETQRDFTWSKEDLEYLKQEGQLRRGRAWKCWTSKFDKFVASYNGEEEFYCLPNERINRIHDPECQQRIQEIRDTVNMHFPQWDDDIWDNARMFYNIED